MSPEGEQRRRRLTLLGLSALAALVVVGVLIAVSQSGDDGGGESTAEGRRPAGTGEATSLYRGISQEGARLGDPDAPVTVVEFADLQCPFCAEYTRNVLPELVRRYVRTGEVKMELRPLTFLGEDCERAGGAAAAAAQRNRLWQFTDLFYADQGAENSGYVTDAFLTRIARAAGLEPAPLLAAAETPAAAPLLRQAARDAQQLGANSTPSFFIAAPGGELEPLEVTALEPGEFTAALDSALGR